MRDEDPRRVRDVREDRVRQEMLDRSGQLLPLVRFDSALARVAGRLRVGKRNKTLKQILTLKRERVDGEVRKRREEREERRWLGQEGRVGG